MLKKLLPCQIFLRMKGQNHKAEKWVKLEELMDKWSRNQQEANLKSMVRDLVNQDNHFKIRFLKFLLE